MRRLPGSGVSCYEEKRNGPLRWGPRHQCMSLNAYLGQIYEVRGSSATSKAWLAVPHPGTLPARVCGPPSGALPMDMRCSRSGSGSGSRRRKEVV